MLAASRLHTTLKKGTTTWGAWQMLAGSNLARQIAGTGVDWICVDTEHGNIDDAQMHDAVTAISATSISPIVRIAANEPWMVKRALDSGAHGIMVPLLRTPADAQALVLSAKFPPLGTRGFGSPFAQQSFNHAHPGHTGGVGMLDYLQQANESLLTIVQIETKEALENVEAIAAVDGIDVLFVGPFDLGNNIGRPIIGDMHEELKAAIVRIHEAAVAKGKWSGIYCTSGAQARTFADQGFHMISVSGDVMALQNYIAQQVTAAKGTYAHSAMNMAKGAVASISGPYGK